MQTFYRGVEENKIRQDRCKKALEVANGFNKDPQLLYDYISQLKASRIITARTLLLHTHRCILSMGYRLTRESPSITIPFDADGSLTNNITSGLRKMTESNLIISTKNGDIQDFAPIIVESDNDVNKVFAHNWQLLLASERKISFFVPCDLESEENHHDIRIKDIWSVTVQITYVKN
jgi:hypothetical protein